MRDRWRAMVVQSKKATLGWPFCCQISGSSTWARTRDLRINSPALYRLSYRGIYRYEIATARMQHAQNSWLLDLGSNQGPTD